MNDARGAARIFFLILAAVWAGAIIGVSFIATPVKFQAPSLSIPVGLEVGRYTFRLFARVELCFLIGLIVTATVARPQRITVFALAVVTTALLLERYWLLPVLDRRVSQILTGGAISFSASHWLYAAFEAVKAALLIAAAASYQHCFQQLHFNS